MVLTMRIILRAVCLSGVSSANFATSLALAVTWQSMQFMLREAEINPIVPMNSFTVSPRRTWTFLKTSSAICGFCSGPAWLLAGVIPSRYTIGMAARIVRLDPGFMCYLFLAALGRRCTLGKD